MTLWTLYDEKLISCQKGCRCGLDMKKPPMGSTCVRPIGGFD